MNKLALAVYMAAKAHLEQEDKGENAYILHPLWVMDRLTDFEEKQAGAMHDVIEDTDLTLDDLRKAGFSDAVVQMIDNVSRRKGEKYSSLIERAASMEGSRNIKKFDIRHNSNTLRVKGFEEKDMYRTRKYQLAYHYLDTLDYDLFLDLQDHERRYGG